MRAAQRPASPAAHSMKQARRLADESRAIRGRVHAVVGRRVTLQDGLCAIPTMNNIKPTRNPIDPNKTHNEAI